ncbi:MAG: SDR family NAD(P)-dependent oxidoreductase [Alphaproteobacteria bacterium]
MQDKAIIVTSASSGLGAATARQLGAEGAKVVLAARHRDKGGKIPGCDATLFMSSLERPPRHPLHRGRPSPRCNSSCSRETEQASHPYLRA